MTNHFYQSLFLFTNSGLTSTMAEDFTESKDRTQHVPGLTSRRDGRDYNLTRNWLPRDSLLIFQVSLLLFFLPRFQYHLKLISLSLCCQYSEKRVSRTRRCEFWCCAWDEHDVVADDW